MIGTLILGGGLAGAAAALWLAGNGHSATIIEARPRLGGRADSRDGGRSGGPVEYGGGWIRTDHAEVIALAQRLGINRTPRAAIASHSHFRDGSFHLTPADDMAEHNAAIVTLQTDAAQMASDSPTARLIHGMTLTHYMDHRALPASARREILAWWSISGSGDPSRIGANEYVTPKLARGLLIKLEELAYTVGGGVTSLAREAACASGAEVLLGDPDDAMVKAALAAAFPGAELVSCDWHDWCADPSHRAHGCRRISTPCRTTPPNTGSPITGPPITGPRRAVWPLPGPIFTVPNKPGSKARF